MWFEHFGQLTSTYSAETSDDLSSPRSSFTRHGDSEFISRVIVKLLRLSVSWIVDRLDWNRILWNCSPKREIQVRLAEHEIDTFETKPERSTVPSTKYVRGRSSAWSVRILSADPCYGEQRTVELRLTSDEGGNIRLHAAAWEMRLTRVIESLAINPMRNE